MLIKEEEPVNQDDEDQVKSDTLIIERFFKVMTPDFHTTLRLPVAFCKKLKAGIPENAVLMSRKGTWNVKIGVNGRQQVCFKEGWDKFAESHELEVGNFAIFEHEGNMHFKVLVYDSSCCENQFSSESSSEEEKAPDFGPDIYEHVSRKIKRGRPSKISMSSQQNRQFTTKIYTRNNVRIPKSFCKSNKLEGMTHILLNGPSGEVCEVNLNWNNAGQCFHTTSGWLEFCKSNGLKEGDICIFKLSCDPSTSACPIKLNVQVIQAPN